MNDIHLNTRKSICGPTCGVGQPVMGVPGCKHRAMLKNTRYFLSVRPEFKPHLCPLESIGASNFSTSPFLIPEKIYVYIYKYTSLLGLVIQI